jgi:putative transposase
MDPARETIGRHKPASGVLISADHPTIVFVTVCTANRTPWLTEPGVRDRLIDAWTKADAWLIGYYLLMPDHLHLFCAPQKFEITLDNWITYWKRLFTRQTQNPNYQWQSGHWDTRLRRSENYQQEWNYVRNNPVRKGLTTSADSWPHQGVLHTLPW